MSTFNLNAEPCDIGAWTQLQTEVCMSIANAKFYQFVFEAERLADFVRLGLITRAIAGEMLQEAANYNALAYEYGQDRVQHIMSAALIAAALSEAAA
jgi:hypothetical protein